MFSMDAVPRCSSRFIRLSARLIGFAWYHVSLRITLILLRSNATPIGSDVVLWAPAYPAFRMRNIPRARSLVIRRSRLWLPWITLIRTLTLSTGRDVERAVESLVTVRRVASVCRSTRSRTASVTCEVSGMRRAAGVVSTAGFRHGAPGPGATAAPAGGAATTGAARRPTERAAVPAYRIHDVPDRAF